MGIAQRWLGRSEDRLSAQDASFLYFERPTELLHVGSVAVLDGSVALEPLTALLAERLGSLRRYRQRPMRAFLDWTAPTWEDDPHYDPRQHVKRMVARAPGDDAALHAAVDELFARPMPADRPLWETWLIDGLAGGRSAILSKVHHCMVDGVSGAQVLEVMTDPVTRAPAAVAGPPVGFGRAPASPGGAAALLQQARHVASAAGLVASMAMSPLRALSWNGPLSAGRRIVWATLSLDDVLAMRGAAGCKVNDVVLAIIAGALHRWMPPGAAPDGVRTLVPVSIRALDQRLALGNQVSGILATLPVEVADPLERLARVARDLQGLKESGQAQAMSLMLALAGALPSPVTPLVATLTTRTPLVHTVCTNVPGPREPRAILGRRIVDLHPIVPLGLQIGLGFAILSYADRLSICATADPVLVPNADRLAGALLESMAELRERLGVAPASAVARPAPAGLTAVAELMATEVATVRAGDTLATAWRLMRERRIRHLPVVDGTGRVVGILTHRDLLGAQQSTLAFRREDERVRLLAWAMAGDVMETHVSTATPDEPAAAAGERMARHKIGCLPVVAGGRLVGIVTQEDFLRWAVSHMPGAAEAQAPAA